ncbi:MAG TPA: sigma-54 dependent transcriptional regulator [Longimicrobiales bacterium]
MRALALTPYSDELSSIVKGLGPADWVIEDRPAEGLVRLREREWPLVLVDEAFNDGGGLELVSKISARMVVVMARSVSIDLAARALEEGAHDLLAFPPDTAKLRELMAAAAASGSTRPAIAVREAGPAGALIGRSPGMLAAFKAAARVAVTGATVLITGESGAGKELLARDLHRHSTRSRGPFIAVNCAAIPDALVESELFGHEAGAFTGAVRRRRGRFERASTGTLFLDEVGDMGPAMQAKILRALQEGEVERVGGEGPVPVDVRVIAATNRDLRRAVAEGKFREDLYYRLAVAVIHLPPLRERGDDIPLLASHFTAMFSLRDSRGIQAIAAETLDILRRYPWPGNVRELKNVIERAVLVADGSVLLPRHLPPEIRGERRWLPTAAGESPPDGFLPLHELEYRYIRHALEVTGGHLARAAKLLGIHRNTLRRKLHEHQL